MDHELITIYLRKAEEKRRRAQLELEKQRGWKEEGAALRLWREGVGFSSPSQMAKEIGVSSGRIERLERGSKVNDRNLLYHAYVTRLYYQEALVAKHELKEKNQVLSAQINKKTIKVEVDGYKFEVPMAQRVSRRSVI